MSSAAKSILVDGVYLLGLEVVLLIIPNIPLSIVGISETHNEAVFSVTRKPIVNRGGARYVSYGNSIV